MSAQIDIISERSELGQGPWVRIEEIGKASTATLDDRYRFAEPNVNLTWPLCVRRSPRPFAEEVKVFFQASSFWRATVLAMYRAKARSFSPSAHECF